jgi:hypothetical protein
MDYGEDQLMKAKIYNPIIDQGSIWNVVVEYQDNNGNPINLNGFTASLQLRVNYNSAVADLTLTTENGGLAIAGAQGTITIFATAEQTGTLDAGFYVYDLELKSGSNITRLIQGQLTVAEQVTRV